MALPLFRCMSSKRSLYRTKTSDSLTTMSTISTSTSSSRPTSRGYDTGFPDSFAACTTSLRHPDAIVDPGYSMSTEDIDPSKTFHRSRKSFLSKRKRRTVSHGLITHELNQHPNASASSVLPSIDSAIDIIEIKEPDDDGSIGGLSKDGADSIDHIDELNKGNYLTPNSDFRGSKESLEDGSRRNRIFGKWRGNKD
ncbi:hypothetical protein F5X99DRAFT_146353 [Biscogniauxia marginata]|nr:hypothetical protein F5X99DRAFT_146353 [Biscogniauxia marginata]